MLVVETTGGYTMGNFYVNYTLRGPNQREVATALAGRKAVVAPPRNGCVVVFDEQSDEQDAKLISALASRLSRQFQCPVLATLNHDDDLLWYQLHENGKLIDEYVSSPGYFGESVESSDPAGGDARKLCAAFGATDVATVESVLRRSFGDDEGYALELDRHADLVQALGLSSFAVGTSFGGLTQGEYPEGLAPEDLVHTT
jgi:hypothetical protein